MAAGINDEGRIDRLSGQGCPRPAHDDGNLVSGRNFKRTLDVKRTPSGST